VERLSEVLRMAKAVYVDTSRTATNGKKKRKPHVVFDSEKVFEVDKLTKLKDVTEVYIDTLFPEIYEEVLELLKRCVKVYLLKDISILKKLRMEHNMKKTDENDATLLSKIPRDRFRLLTIQEMEKKTRLRPLINRYELLSKRVKILKQWISGSEEKDDLKNSIKLMIKVMEKEKKKVAKEVIQTLSNDAVYREVCKLLGIKNSVELAILTIELPLHLSLNTLKAVVGLTPNRNKGRFNHSLHDHLSRLAINIYVNVKRWKDRWEAPEEFREIVDSLPREKAIYKLHSRILKMFRRAYFLAND